MLRPRSRRLAQPPLQRRQRRRSAAQRRVRTFGDEPPRWTGTWV